MTTLNIRSTLIKRRARLPLRRRKLAERAISNLIISLPSFQAAKHIALYFPYRGEFNTQALIEACLSHGKNIYFPVILSPTEMGFYPWKKGEALKTLPSGILEPLPSGEPIARDALDIMIMPVVGFNEHYYRLGSGCGYFDRYLAGHTSQKPVLLGVAFDCQFAPDFMPHEWDVAMDLVVTEALCLPA